MVEGDVSSGEVVTISDEGVCVSKVFCSSACFFCFSLSAIISSNHFSKIGIASSKFWVPDENIFCFPSI